MSGSRFHRIVEGGAGRIRLSRFVFQAGIGAVASTLVWAFLTSVEWQPGRADLLPLVLFGVSLPWLAFPIPAHIVSSATASGRFLMSVSIGLALLSVAVSIGRFVFSWDRAFVILVAGLISSLGVLAQSIWGRLWTAAELGGDRPVTGRDGFLSYGGWIAGISAGPLISLAVTPHAALWLGAAALAASGWLIQFVPRKSTSANWLSNRSALRLFSAIENAFRSGRSRTILLRIFWFSGASLSLVSMIAGGWNSSSGNTVWGGVTSDTPFLALALLMIVLMAGLAIGSAPRFAGLGRHHRVVTLAVVCLAVPASALGLSVLPLIFKVPLALVFGAGCGVVLDAAYRDLRESLGPVFVGEAGILSWTVGGAGGVLFCGCFWLGHAITGFGPLLLGAEILLFGGFFLVWCRRWTPGIDPDGSAFDPWYPGKFPAFSKESSDACLVSIAYEIAAEQRDAFKDAIRSLAHLRQKQGALFWTLAESAENPEILKEQFIVESQSAFQDAVRAETEEEREIKQRVFDLNHWDSLPCESRHPLIEA